MVLPTAAANRNAPPSASQNRAPSLPPSPLRIPPQNRQRRQGQNRRPRPRPRLALQPPLPVPVRRRPLAPLRLKGAAPTASAKTITPTKPAKARPLWGQVSALAAAGSEIGWWKLDAHRHRQLHQCQQRDGRGFAHVHPTGKVGQAILLNGTSQYGERSLTPPVFDLTTGMTLAAWIRPTGHRPTTQNVIKKASARPSRLDNGYELSLSSDGQGLRPSQSGNIGRHIPGQLDDLLPAQQHRLDACRRYL